VWRLRFLRPLPSCLKALARLADFRQRAPMADYSAAADPFALAPPAETLVDALGPPVAAVATKPPASPAPPPPAEEAPPPAVPSDDAAAASGDDAAAAATSGDGAADPAADADAAAAAPAAPEPEPEPEPEPAPAPAPAPAAPPPPPPPELHYVLYPRPRDAALKHYCGMHCGESDAAYARVFDKALFAPLATNLDLLLQQVVVMPLETIAKAKALNANGAAGPLRLAKLLTTELKKSAGHHEHLIPKHHYTPAHATASKKMDEYRRQRQAQAEHRAAVAKRMTQAEASGGRASRAPPPMPPKN